MRRLEYFEPRGVEEACRILSELDGKATILAGGTDVVPKMKTGVLRPHAIVNIKRIPDLDSIKEDGGEGILIGALTPISKLAADPLIARRFESLSTAARSIGSYQVRNLATVGGNLCNAAPSADMAPPLIAMDAKVMIASSSGFRETDLQDFFEGPGKVILRRGELLAGIRVPFPPGNTCQTYLKHSIRRAMDIAMVSIAVALSFEPRTGVCHKARVVLGAVAPTPVRARGTEEILVGKTLKEVPFKRVSDRVREEAAPITDIRASSSYRSDMVSILTVRAIRSLERVYDEQTHSI
jgi:CO/xanthine dehydrogenase FAD-binding subunit